MLSLQGVFNCHCALNPAATRSDTSSAAARPWQHMLRSSPEASGSYSSVSGTMRLLSSCCTPRSVATVRARMYLPTLAGTGGSQSPLRMHHTRMRDVARAFPTTPDLGSPLPAHPAVWQPSHARMYCPHLPARAVSISNSARINATWRDHPLHSGSQSPLHESYRHDVAQAVPVESQI